MTELEQGLVTLVGLLDQVRVPYMVVGGLASIVWGEPRATLDIDVVVWVPEPEIAALVAKLAADLPPLVSDPFDFIQNTRVLPLQSSSGFRIDLIFGMLPFEEQAIGRAVTFQLQGVNVKFCSAEDLILMKIISERDQDIADARAVALRRFSQLDRAYLEPRIDEPAMLLERPEIARRWEAWKSAARSSGK